MKTSILINLILVTLISGCVSRPVYETSKRGTSSVDCVQNFNRAVVRFRELVKTHGGVFGRDYIAKISALPADIKVSCVAELKNTYGSAVDRKDNSVSIEEQLQSVGLLLDSDIGAAKISEYNIDSRYVTYDRLLVAVAAHSMAEMTGIDDKNYDVFFRTLKALEVRQNGN